MSSLTIITATRPDRGDYLPNLAVTIDAAIAPLIEGEALHRCVWHIHTDGPPTDVCTTLLADVLDLMNPAVVDVHLSRGAISQGAAVTRTAVLAAVDTTYTMTVNDDDVLLPGVRDAILTLNETPDIGYTVGSTVAHTGCGWIPPMLPLTTDVPWWNEYADYAGFDHADDYSVWLPELPPRIDPGDIQRMHHNAEPFPVLGTTAIYRTTLVGSVGGWPDTPTGEDAALLLAVSNRVAGMSLEAPVIGHRRHDVG